MVSSIPLGRSPFSANTFIGQTPTGEKLGQILKYYIPDIGGMIRPINIIVITAGEPCKSRVPHYMTSFSRFVLQLMISSTC